MKALLKNTQIVEVDLPEYFSYTRYSQVNYCRLMGDKIAEVSCAVLIRSAASLIENLVDVDIADFSEITKQEFRIKLNEMIEKIISE